MTAMWDRLQEEESCCGVIGPVEYNTTIRWEMPPSCCAEPPPTNSSTKCAKPHVSGCDERLLAYLRTTASVLAIIGYCVLAFLKLCFLGILRYEIREMIQKIRILRTELEVTNANGTVPGAIRAESAESERESLLVRPESAALLSSPPTQTKNPNGNNNYEMREYRSHENIWLKYRLEGLFNRGRWGRVKKGPLATPLEEIFKRKPRNNSRVKDDACWNLEAVT